MVWHVNNTKESQKIKAEVPKFVEYMKEIYGKNMPVIRGNKHTYVKMDLDYSFPREVIVSMDSYIAETIDDFTEEMIKL